MQYTITVKFYTNQYSVAVTIVSVNLGNDAGCGNQDVTSSAINFLPGYFSLAQAALGEITTLLLSNMTGAGTSLPYGPSYKPYASTNVSSTTRQIMWSVAKSSGLSPGISFYPSNQFLSYGQPTNNGVWYGTYVTPGSTSRTRYNVDQSTGVYGTVFTSGQTYNASTRPWFQPARSALGQPTVVPPFGSPPGQPYTLYITTTQAFYNNGVFAGAVYIDLCLYPSCGPLTLSQSLATINNGAAAVVYVMQTSNGVLLGE